MTPLFGHHNQQKWLISSLREGRLHHGIILAGRKGLGKFLFAQHAAAAILSQDQDMDYIDNLDDNSPLSLLSFANIQTAKLISQRHHPDLHIIKRGPKNKEELKKAQDGKLFERGRNIKVDQIRELQRRFSTRPTLGRARVIIIDSADDLERGAANALLKSLEEPSEHTYFLLISHNPGKLLPTIRSRCQLQRFDPLGAENMLKYIEHVHGQMDQSEAQSLLEISGGIPGDMAAASNSKQSELLSIARQIIQHGDDNHKFRVMLARGVSRMKMDEMLALIRCFPPLLAQEARQSTGPSRQAAIESWSCLRELVDSAPSYNYDNQGLIFHIAGLLAEPARIRTSTV